MRLGRHMPKGVDALARAREIGCDAVQVFVTNPRGWQPPAPAPDADTALLGAARDYGQDPLVVHAAYIINLASARADVCEQSEALLAVTAERAERIGARHVVFHIGSHGGTSEDEGLARLIVGLRRVLAVSPPSVMLLLENDTGGGGKLGYCFANLAAVLDALPEARDRLGVCLDTAHLWGAGFNVSTPEGVAATLDEADRVLGLAHVPVVHVNDARVACGSHRDIHARFDEGEIGPQGIAAFMQAPQLAHTTGLLETPFPEARPGHIDWAAEHEHMTLARTLAGLI